MAMKATSSLLLTARSSKPLNVKPLAQPGAGSPERAMAVSVPRWNSSGQAVLDRGGQVHVDVQVRVRGNR
jgi:hypothetical protein